MVDLKKLELDQIVDGTPEEQLRIWWPDSNAKADLGNILTPTQIKNDPMVSFTPETPDSYYTLIFVDPDAPSRQNPIYSQVLHWLIVNIPGNQVSKGETKCEYLGTGPPKGSGLHRYGVFLFKQKHGKQDFSSVFYESKASIQNRPFFNTKDFVSKHQLGKLYAANYFQAEYDEYCEELYKKYNIVV